MHTYSVKFAQHFSAFCLNCTKRWYARSANRWPKKFSLQAQKVFYEGKVLFDNDKSSLSAIDQMKLTQEGHGILRDTKKKNRAGGSGGKSFKLPDYVKYDKLSEDSREFGQDVMQAKSKKMREKSQTILLEGTQLITDAIISKVPIYSIYFDTIEHLKGLPFELLGDTRLCKVSSSLMKVWSNQVTPTAMAIAELPKVNSAETGSEDSTLTLICDQVRDPGNLGTLLRTAVACGCQNILTTKGSVDAWDPKVLRAGCGAHFEASIFPGLTWDKIGHWLSKKTMVCIADNVNKENMDQDLKIKTPRRVLQALTRKNEAEVYTEYDEELRQQVTIDSSFLDSSLITLCEKLHLECDSLFDVDFTALPNVALIIGGETEGISPSAKKLAFDYGGQIVYIPMERNTESLNAAVAGSIIMFEIKRQMAVKQNSLSSTENEHSVGHAS